MAVLLAFVGPAFGVMSGVLLRGRFRPRRRFAVVIAGMFVALAVLEIVAASRYPGPAHRYVDGSSGWIVREWFVAPCMWLLLVSPSMLALAASVLPQRRRDGVIAGLATGYLSTPATWMVLLYVGCNHAGACL